LAIGVEQDNLALADFDLQATVFGDIGDTGDTVQAHVRAPDRHFSYEFAPPCEVQPIATAKVRTVQL
jgi:hypothetical protein